MNCSRDHFEDLPDAILLLVFAKLLDAKSLTRCLAVSTRFASLVPQSLAVSFSFPTRRRAGSKTSLLRKLFKEPIRSLRRAVGSKTAARRCSGGGGEDLHHSPEAFLKNFAQIRDLRIEVPLRRDTGVAAAVRWRADFGSQIRSCVILGADSFARTGKSEPNNRIEAVSRCDLESRIVWTISCLIEASSRHHLARRVAAARPLLRRVEVTDGEGHGRLRVCVDVAAAPATEEEVAMGRTAVPDLRMKMWYAAELELPAAGRVMRGATLVVIRPALAEGRVKASMVVRGAFDGVEEEEEGFAEAARLMVKMKKTYTLEMTSF